MESDEERSSQSNGSSNGSGTSSNTNRCQRVREHDMDQMRSSASSPSTISTASSGSPLVRGHSKGSTSGGSGAGGVKRPAPTSIAAAQLQCQQQRMNLKTSSSSSNHHQQHQLHHHHHHSMKSATSSSLNGGSSGNGNGNSNGNGNYANGIVKPEKQPKQQHEENKSFGYNVAKSIAYRAYRFNEFWTLDKMSYLNLACLLMTLVCLITIVLFSTSTSSGNNINNNTGNHQHHHHNQLQAPSSHHLRSQARSGQSNNLNLSARKFQSSSDQDQDQELESVPEPSSQSLAAGTTGTTTNSKDDSLFDDYAFGDGEIRSKLSGGGSSNSGSTSTMATDYPDDDPVWPPRKSSSLEKGSVAKLRRKSGPEREIEDFPSSINESQSKMTSSNQEQTSNQRTKEQPDEQQQQTASSTGSSSSSSSSGLILEPILSQIFKDLELGSLFKAVLNGTSSNGGGSRKPIIRRSKNGATIIISSSFNESSLANNNNNNQSNFIPSLLQKLLPPMLFKPHHSTGNNNKQTSQFQFGGDNLAGSATITISGRAIELPPPPSSFMGSPLSSSAAAASAGPSGLQESPFSLPTSLFPSFMSPAASSFPPPSSHSFRSFFPEPMAIRMNSLVSSPSQFAAVPYPSALGMMLRSMAADAEEEASSSSSSSSSPSTNKRNINNKMSQSKLSNTNETLNTQASQQQQQTMANVSAIATTSNNNNKTENATATTTTTSNDPEVETFDVSQLMPFKLPLPPMHRSRISLIAPSPNHHQSVMIFGSSANPENPFMSGGSGGGIGGGGSPFNPFSGGLPSISPPMPIMPHMMMMASGTGLDSGSLLTPPNSPSTWSTMSNGPFPMPFNPILRALLGNLASGSPDSSSSDKNNKTSNTNEGGSIDRYDRDPSGATATMRVFRPIFAPIDMMDSLSPVSSSSSQAAAATSASLEEPETVNENLRQQMRARHRSAADMMLDEMDLPDNNGGGGGGNQPQASSDFGNLQEQQQQQQPFEQSSSSGIIRQTIRGPGMTVERIIEVPSASNNQVQQVPRGVRSQSISRIAAEDMGENNGNSGHDESNKPTSTSVNRRNQQQQQQQQPTAIAAAIERRDDGQFMMEEPMGMIGPNRMNFIGKLLSDLSRRATSPRFLSLNRSDLDLDREMIDDSAEAKPEPSGLSSNSIWGPKVRVASARVRLRPSATSPEALFLSPINSQLLQQQQQQQHQHQHQSMQPNGGNQEMSLFQEPLNSGEQQGKQLSLEDTLNSMEDRLDKVLSMASQYTSTPTAAAAAAGGNQFHHRAIITPVEKPTKGGDQQKSPSSIDNQSIGQAPENPYTSPTSPLFGFPASSASSSMMPAPTAAGDSQQALSNENENNNSNDKKTKSREPRSFTYHSNNELASDIKQKLQRMELEQQQQQQQAEMRAAESIGRASKFGPFLAPPAGAMGRRLDDGPFGDSFSSSSSESSEEQQQQEPTAAVNPSSNPIGVVTNFLEGRAMMPATGSHQKRPEVATTTNNEASHFRTIIV